MGLSPETHFGFGYTARLWAFRLDVWASIVNVGMRDSFGIVQFSGKPREKQKHSKVSMKGLGGRQESFCFCF